MKKFKLLTVISLFALIATAQPPQMFNYQAVVRNAGGELVTGELVGFQIEILEGSASGSAVYTETHSTTTNDYGLATLEIGGGTSGDDFTAIDWGANDYFLKVSVDISGGTDYQDMGTTQLLSVPYALYAENVGIEPQIAYKETVVNPFNLTNTTNTQLIDSIEIEVPSPGKVKLEASGYIIVSHVVGTEDNVGINIYEESGLAGTTTIFTTGVSSFTVPDDLPTGSYRYPFSCMKAIDADTPGTHKYYLYVRQHSGANIASTDVYRITICATYFPE